MADPKLWPTKTKEGERDWYVEARIGSGNYRGEPVRFVRDWYTDKGRQYTNEPAEDMIAQLLEERDAAIRKGAAERAMLDEILALPDIEAPTEDGSENVASVVANALEALREERDAAISRAKAMAAVYDGAITDRIRRKDAEKARDAAILERDEQQKRADRAVEDRAVALNVTSRDGLLSSEWVLRTGYAEKWAKTAARERDEERERAEKAEALLATLKAECESAISVGNTCAHKGAEVISVKDLSYMAKDLATAYGALLSEIREALPK